MGAKSIVKRASSTIVRQLSFNRKRSSKRENPTPAAAPEPPQPTEDEAPPPAAEEEIIEEAPSTPPPAAPAIIEMKPIDMPPAPPIEIEAEMGLRDRISSYQASLVADQDLAARVSKIKLGERRTTEQAVGEVKSEISPGSTSLVAERMQRIERAATDHQKEAEMARVASGWLKAKAAVRIARNLSFERKNNKKVFTTSKEEDIKAVKQMTRPAEPSTPGVDNTGFFDVATPKPRKTWRAGAPPSEARVPLRQIDIN